jgi:hypothetical protein
MSDQNHKATDLACGRSAVLLWWLPVIVLIVGANWPKFELLWFPAFLVMGAACLANAARCGRVHCYVTGPLFLLAAIYVVLWGFHLVPMQPNIFLGSICGVFLFARLAEIPLGKYRKHACTDQ